MWECKKCGACCRSPFTKFWLPELWDEEKKRCKNLTDDNLCSVYDNRPKQCQDLDFTKIPRGEEFRTIWCEFLDKHINQEDKMNCLVKELSRVNNLPIDEIKNRLAHLFVDHLLPFKKTLDLIKDLSTEGILFVHNGNNWHANDKVGLPLSEIDIKDNDLIGEPMSAATALLLGSGISAGGSILGGLFGSDDEEEWEPKYLQLPDYAESDTARQNWSKWLQENNASNNYGATDMNWDEIFNTAKSKLNRYYWGGVNDTGLAGKVKASAARRGVSQSPALETNLSSLGMQEAIDLNDLTTNLTTQKASYTENARNTWLSSLMNLAGLKPTYLTNAGLTTGGTTYDVGNAVSDVSSGVGSLLTQYASSQSTDDVLTKLINSLNGGTSQTSQSSLTSGFNLGSLSDLFNSTYNN